MKIAIINCPIRENAKPNNVPLGIYYLVSAIKKEYDYADIKILDLNAIRPVVTNEDLCDLLYNFKDCDMILISGLITTYKWQKQIVSYFRSHAFERSIGRKHMTIITGGGLASNLEEKTFDLLDVDTICIGEGDWIVNDVIRDYIDDNLKRVYRNDTTKEINGLLPDWNNVYGLETYINNPIWGLDANNSSNAPFSVRRSLNIITSRGCPYSCAFCNRDISGGKDIRFNSQATMIKECMFLEKEYKVDFIGILDDNFAVDRSRIRDFCFLKVNYGLNFKWGGHIRFNNADDYDLLKTMKESGCVYLGFGGESANADILKRMKKGNKPEQMIRVLEYCRDLGIHPNVTWMMGWPGETREQMRDTAQFILKYAPENKNMFVATAYPKTALFEEVKDKIFEKFGNLRSYVKELDDATKTIINFSALEDEEFDEIREYVKEGRIDKI